MSALLVYSTVPDADTANRIARTLVDEGLAACVSVLPGITSTYRWQDAIHVDAELLLMAKTTRERHDALAARLLELHPYELPEIIAVEAAAGHAPYLAWVARQTQLA